MRSNLVLSRTWCHCSSTLSCQVRPLTSPNLPFDWGVSGIIDIGILMLVTMHFKIIIILFHFGFIVRWLNDKPRYWSWSRHRLFMISSWTWVTIVFHLFTARWSTKHWFDLSRIKTSHFISSWCRIFRSFRIESILFSKSKESFLTLRHSRVISNWSWYLIILLARSFTTIFCKFGRWLFKLDILVFILAWTRISCFLRNNVILRNNVAFRSAEHWVLSGVRFWRWSRVVSLTDRLWMFCSLSFFAEVDFRSVEHLKKMSQLTWTGTL